LGSPGTIGFLRMTPLRGVSMPVSYVEKSFQDPWVTTHGFWSWKE